MSYLKATERKILKDLAYSTVILFSHFQIEEGVKLDTCMHIHKLSSYLAVSWGSILPTGFDGLP